MAGVLLTMLTATLVLGSTSCAGPPRPQDHAGFGAPNGTVTANAAEILRQMTEHYAATRSYEDTGLLSTVFYLHGIRLGPPSHIGFRTAFDRESGDYGFEFRHTHAFFFPPTGGAIWRSGGGLAHDWFSAGGGTERVELQQAISSLAGVSLGTSRYVPWLLLRSANSGRWAWPDDGLSYGIDGEEVVNGVSCVRMSAQRDSLTVVLWIGKADHSLRRRVERSTTAMSEDTVEWMPTFDRSIDPARFNLTPP